MSVSFNFFQVEDRNLKPVVAALLVFIGCMSNVILLEVLVKNDPGSGNLITFSQFIFIAIEGFIFTSKFGTAKTYIKKSEYVKIVVLFFIVNVLNNYAFDFNVPVPLHIIFRSGSLIVNMVMGVIILKRSYSILKYLSVIMITFGICLCTLMSGKEIKSTNPRVLTTHEDDLFWWIIGIIILTLALCLSAILGIFQESLFQKYGKHPREALFFTHLLPLPLFLFISRNIYDHFLLAINSEPYVVFKIFSIPTSILHLILNVLTQYLCISSVFTLTSESSSLIVTLVLTLRKFSSLMFSIFYFKNPFTFYHWVGTVAVLMGTILFTEIHDKLYKIYLNRKVNKKKLK